MKKYFPGLLMILSLLSISFLSTPTPVHAQANSDIGSTIGSSLSCSMTATQFQNAAAVSVIQNSGSTMIYAGYTQVTGTNKNPVIARFNSNGTQVWCRDDIETSADNSVAYGLYWDGGDNVYAIFNAGVNQGSVNTDYRRFTTNGWLKTYADAGGGSGQQVAVVLKISALDGEPAAGTYITTVQNNGTTGGTGATHIEVAYNDHVVMRLNASASPRNRDKSAMACTGTGPFAYYIQFDENLTQVYGSTASNCTPNLNNQAPSQAPVPQDMKRSLPGEDEANVPASTSFIWESDPYSTWYHIIVLNNANTTIHDQWYEGAVVCSGEDCQTPSVISLPSGKLTWWLSSWGPDPEGQVAAGFMGHYVPSIFYVGPPPPNTINLLAPNGPQTGAELYFDWDADENAEWYNLIISDEDGTLYNQWYAATDEIGNPYGYDGICGESVCSIPANANNIWLTNGEFTWDVRGWNSSDYSPANTTPSAFSFNLDAPELTLPDPGMQSAGLASISWPHATEAVWYQLWVGAADYSTTYYYQPAGSLSTDICVAMTCSIDVNLAEGEAEIWLRAWGPGGMSIGDVAGGWDGPVVFDVISYSL